jgi:hypothetical protein
MRPRAPRAVLAVVVAGALLVAGCEDGAGSDAASPSGSGATPGASPSPPAGASSGPTSPAAGATDSGSATPTNTPVELTGEGTALAFGDTAVVRHAAGRRGTTDLGLTVRSARQGRLSDFAGFDLSDPYARNASYFYVRVRVDNLGTRRVGPYEVPLRGVSDANTLLPPVRLTADFPACRTQPVPRGFRPGASLQTCLVYLSPDRGGLVGVAYRPTPSYQPIMWTGDVRPPRPVKGPAKGKTAGPTPAPSGTATGGGQ